ncbi:hypothetical protein EDEG_00675 [Edhazardia aedis USNM 41457]|uniref:RING-type domain-containing protein n=1 Tax=Edhazardia aedis (strain USNM 41457) TaxID=1003232 RepID=J9DRL8_EDHAE|nr:hypothetical protein EDEG_00675 [Edhazardia aedis USNM 41457]|eukprot:EJW05210.1 hypothetical protein EDEG_00675 [Edhazardia aedis USNM 41457]
MSALKCPLCKTDAYLNPEIKIYISPCYHKICDSCLNRVFFAGQAPCPECNIPLRKINYMSQTFEDMEVERECKLRKMLSQYYYLTLKYFNNDIHKYNDYLEDFEDKIFYILSLEDTKQTEILMNEIKNKFGEISEKNRIDEIEDDSQEGFVKKLKSDISSPIQFKEINSEVEPLKDPLHDVEFVPKRITQKNIIPDCFKVNFSAGGFTENLLIFKAVYSLYDDKI